MKKNKYVVEVKFEANVEIEAASEEEALMHAWIMADDRSVVDGVGRADEDFVLMDPKVVEVR